MILRARIILMIAVSLGMIHAAGAQAVGSPASGVDLVRSMHDRYAGQWYRTLTFVQRTTKWDSTGARTISTWYESLAVPSTLRIDIGPPREGNGVLFTADSTYVVRKGQLVRTSPGGNDLTTLLFDVYVDPVDTTLATLRSLGFDLDRIRRDTCAGRATYIVGADAGDLTRPQFWVDSERLVVVRSIGPIRPGSPTVLDGRFTKYVRAGGGWISLENTFFFGLPPAGASDRRHPDQLEEYSNVRTGVALGSALFDPRQWLTARHWAHPD